MKVDLEELKRKAEAAGGRKWYAHLGDRQSADAIVHHDDGDAVCKCYSNIGHQPEAVDKADIAAYIAAANPAAVSELIAEIERLRAENDRLQDICAAAYQMAGLVGAPVRFLDALSNPCDATQEQIDALLPVGEDEIDAARSAPAGDERGN